MISLSPDGAKVDVLAHFSDGAKSVYRIEVLALPPLVGSTYNATGLAFHKQGVYWLSAPLFKRAFLVSPDAKWHAFNMACAYARLIERLDPDSSLVESFNKKAQGALEAVIKQKNKDIIKKLETDPDLNSLGQEDWFQRLHP